MLALVSLLTGAFLVFSTQSLSVLRRRSSLGLMRALGATAGQIEAALLGEGALIGLAGSIIGLLLGVSFAQAALRFLSGDLGNGQLHAQSAVLEPAPSMLVAFLVIGTVVSGFGAVRPARAASRQSPALALKGGDARSGGNAVQRIDQRRRTARRGRRARMAPAAARHTGFRICRHRRAAVRRRHAGADADRQDARLAPRLGHVVPDTALAQMEDDIGMSTLSLSSIIVSFSLMVAMAIMVYSFRISFERWLDKVLPADVQMREPLGNDTAYWTAADQSAAAATAGVSRAEFRRTRPLLLDPARPPVILIARGATARQTAEQLPLLSSLPATRLGAGEPAWISEELQDLYGYRLGERDRSAAERPGDTLRRRGNLARLRSRGRRRGDIAGRLCRRHRGSRCQRGFGLARRTRTARIGHRRAAQRAVAWRAPQWRARDHDDSGAARSIAARSSTAHSPSPTRSRPSP